MTGFCALPSIMKRLPDLHAWENAMHNTSELAMKVCDKFGVNGAFESGGRAWRHVARASHLFTTSPRDLVY